MKKLYGLINILLISSLFVNYACIVCADNFSLVSLNKDDRILILAPHPDDEAIGTGGIIQEAVRLNIPVKIAYLTNGDNNEIAFLVYKKRPVLSRKELLKMGELRRMEAISAMQKLGVADDQLTFLGYPDAGTLLMFTQYWDTEKPFRSQLTKVKHVPYKESPSFGKSYVGQNVLEDLKEIILKSKPTKIFVTLPVDTNPDHRAYYLFLKVALWDLKNQIQPEVYPFLIHAAKWPAPRGFKPELTLEPPAKLLNGTLFWRKFSLSQEMIDRKKQAISSYVSQIKYNPPYLVSFARKNELFGDFSVIELNQKEEINWSKLEKEENIEGHIIDESKPDEDYIESITYALKDEFLHIKTKSAKWANKVLGVHVFLIGYREDIPFEDMPKVRINISFGSKITVYEGSGPIYISHLNVYKKDKEIFIEFPLKTLGNPGYILTSARARLIDLPIETTAWRVLKLK